MWMKLRVQILVVRQFRLFWLLLQVVLLWVLLMTLLSIVVVAGKYQSSFLRYYVLRVYNIYYNLRNEFGIHEKFLRIVF